MYIHRTDCPQIFAQYGAKDCHCGAKARTEAAALDLLEVLQRLLTTYPSDPIGHLRNCPGHTVGLACQDTCAQARRAIAKARGDR